VRTLTDGQVADLAKLAENRQKIEGDLDKYGEEAETTGDLERKVRLRTWRKEAEQRLQDLDQVKRLIENGVPLSALKPPDPAKVRTRGARQADLRRQALTWLHQRTLAEAATEAARRQQLIKDIQAGKVDASALEALPARAASTTCSLGYADSSSARVAASSAERPFV